MLSCKKDEFSLPEGLHYLNCAYMAPLSRRVEEAGIEGIRRKRVPTTIPPDSFFSEVAIARARFARLVNAPDPNRIALVPSASYAVATVAKNMRLQRGQNVIVAQGQFPSNVYAWRRLVQESGAALRTIVPPQAQAGRGRAWNTRLLEAIDKDTALVALGHVHWADGTRFDLEQIGKRARDVGAALIVDGTQSIGALPFDVQRIQPDMLVCAGYKWLLGPYSLGTAYFGPRFDDGVPLEENWITRWNSEQFNDLVSYQDDYQPGAVRYDVGERSNFILVPMLIAAIEHLLEWDPARIQQYCSGLTADLLREAVELGFQVEEPEWRGAHLFGIRVPTQAPMEQLTDMLKERNISVSLRGDAIRISPNVYNDAADVDALREVLHACAMPA